MPDLASLQNRSELVQRLQEMYGEERLFFYMESEFLEYEILYESKLLHRLSPYQMRRILMNEQSLDKLLICLTNSEIVALFQKCDQDKPFTVFSYLTNAEFKLDKEAQNLTCIYCDSLVPKVESFTNESKDWSSGWICGQCKPQVDKMRTWFLAQSRE